MKKGKQLERRSKEKRKNIPWARMEKESDEKLNGADGECDGDDG